MDENTVLEANLNALKTKTAKVVQSYWDYIENSVSEGSNSVYIGESMDGHKITATLYNNRIWYLNSGYAPQEMAKQWASQFKNGNSQALYIICGLSNGMYLRALLETIKESNCVLIYEPNPDLFCKVINEIDISDILADDRTFVSVKNICEYVGSEIINLLISYSNMRLVEYKAIPNYDQIYKQDWAELITRIKNRMEILVLDRNTQINFAGEFIQNMLTNYKDIIKQSTTMQLKEEIDKLPCKNMPAILVSAGPSLDKNISDLKDAKGKAFIMVVDTALKAVLRAGIKPDLVMTIDPHKPLVLFEHEDFHKIPLVVCQYTNHKVIQMHKGKRFYFDDGGTYIAYIYKQVLGVPAAPLESGGSVANNAFSLLRYFNFKTIILIGQDLAYTNNKTHTTASYDNEEKTTYRKGKLNDIVEIEDIYGNKVSTKKNMELYLKWFENQIIRYPETKVIDATEGGAKIRGAEIITLKEAIGRECREICDFETVIEQIPGAFDAEKYQEVLELFSKIPDELDIMDNKIENTMRDYYKLEELIRKKKGHTKECKKVMERIEKVNYDVENEPIMEIASMYNRRTEFEILENIYGYKEDEMEEVREIRERGVKMLKSYREAIEKMRKDIVVLSDE